MEGEELYLQKLTKELKLRKYSPQTISAYLNQIKNFLSSNLTPRDFLLKYVDHSNSTIRSVYFALQFFYKNVLKEDFIEELPLGKNQDTFLKSSIKKKLNFCLMPLLISNIAFY